MTAYFQKKKLGLGYDFLIYQTSHRIFYSRKKFQGENLFG